MRPSYPVAHEGVAWPTRRSACGGAGSRGVATERPLVTLKRSPLEPQTEKKYYFPGVGEVKEKVVKGHHEEFELVRVTHR